MNSCYRNTTAFFWQLPEILLCDDYLVHCSFFDSFGVFTGGKYADLWWNSPIIICPIKIAFESLRDWSSSAYLLIMCLFPSSWNKAGAPKKKKKKSMIYFLSWTFSYLIQKQNQPNTLLPFNLISTVFEKWSKLKKKKIPKE